MNQDSINNKAYAQARLIVRRKIMEQTGTLYESLSPSGQAKIDQLVEKKQKLVKDVAHKLITKFTQHDKSFSHGAPIRNLGRPEGMNENINSMFLEYFPQYDVSNALGQKVDIPMSQQTNPVYRDGKPDDKNKSPIIQYAKFGNEKISDTPVAKAIGKKAQKAGIKEEVLGAVYDRGLDAWTEDTGVSRQQYAFARVNSYINQGKTYFNEDSDLHEGMNYRDSGAHNMMKASMKADRIAAKDRERREKIEAKLSKKKLSEMGGDQHYGDTKGATSGGAKGTPISKDKMKKDATKTLNQLFQKSMKKEEAEIEEARAPGKAYVKPFHNEKGEHVGYVSSTKWGQKKWWRKSEGGIAKAKAHAGVDAISEGRETVHTVARQDDGDRKGIKNVERDPDAKDPINAKSSLTRNTEIQRKIIEAKVGNVEKDPKKRLIGTDSLVKAYTADTPCAKVNETLDESFNIAFAAGVGVTLTAADLGMRAQGGFALHPSVIEEMEEMEEDVTSALKQPVYMPPIRNDDGSYQPARTVMRKTQKKIVRSGNVHDGSVDDLTTGMGPA